MKVIYRAYRYRIYPNKEQAQMLARHFGCVRYVYNYFLAERKRQYEENGKSDNLYAQQKALTLLKKTKDHYWLNEVNAQSLQQSLRHLECAYVGFFRGKSKFPRFKSKKSYCSFTAPQGCYVKNGMAFLPKIKGGLKLKEHRIFNGNVKSMTVSVTPSGKYFVSILTEEEYEPLQKTNANVGIDLGLKDLVITSDGVKYSSNKFIKKYSKKLKTAQKHLSRKQKGSSSWKRQRIKVARIHEKISNCRKDKLHKISTDLIREYDVICCEDLAVKNLVKNHKLANAISDASWYMFLSYLTYKAQWNNKQVVKIGRFYPSSKTCNHCGYVRESLSLRERFWTCPCCGEKVDRDINAAKNILEEGLRISAGTVDYTEGDEVRLARKHSSKKSEINKSLHC